MQENGNFNFNGNQSNNSADDFVIGKGFAVEEYDINNSPKKPKKPENMKHSKNSKGIVKTLIIAACVVAVSAILAVCAIFAGADYLGIGFGRGQDCTLNIPMGTSTKVIAEKLNETGAVKLPTLFRLYSKLKHYDSKYKYGLYSFNNEIGYGELANMLMTEGAKAETVRVTIPEGNIDDIAKILEDKGVCDKSDFIDEVQNGKFKYDFVKEIPYESVYYRLEGYLFPETYEFYVVEDSKEGAHLAIDKMLKQLDGSLTEKMRTDIKSGKYTFHEVMTLASLVQLEAGNTKEVSDTDRQKVAAVFYNRLKSSEFSTLGSSPTRKYPHGNGRYNTYEVKGLPPGPLCSPNLPSIKAAIYPEKDFDYYYFVTDKGLTNGGIPLFHYNKTLNEHNSTIAKLKKANNWFYEE